MENLADMEDQCVWKEIERNSGYSCDTFFPKCGMSITSLQKMFIALITCLQ